MKCNPMERPVSPRLILASASPRRKDILEEAGYDFEIICREVDEAHTPDLSPQELTTHNASLKAKLVAAEYPDAIVMGADTLVYLDQKPLGKPATREQAHEMLRQLSGRIHYVCTGVALVHHASNQVRTFGVLSEVEFKVLDHATIELYHSLINPMDKAGAYAIQEESQMIIEAIRGSWTNVKGLPLEQVQIELAAFATKVNAAS